MSGVNRKLHLLQPGGFFTPPVDPEPPEPPEPPDGLPDDCIVGYDPQTTSADYSSGSVITTRIANQGNLTSAFATVNIAILLGYMEFEINGPGGLFRAGLSTKPVFDKDIYIGSSGDSWSYGSDGSLYRNGLFQTVFGDTYGAGDVVGIAVDMANQMIWFSKNGVWQGGGDPVAITNPAFTGGLAGVKVYPGMGALVLGDGAELNLTAFNFKPVEFFETEFDCDGSGGIRVPGGGNDTVFEQNPANSDYVLSNGDLTVSKINNNTLSSMLTNNGYTGKTYFEVRIDSSNPFPNEHTVGVSQDKNATAADWLGNEINSWGTFGGTGAIFNNDVIVGGAPAYGPGDTIGVAHDVATGNVWFSKNGSFQAGDDPAAGINPAVVVPPGGTWYAGTYGRKDVFQATGAFKTGDFATTPPAGFNPIPTI